MSMFRDEGECGMCVASGDNAIFIYKSFVIPYNCLYKNAHITVLDNCGNFTHKPMQPSARAKYWAPFGMSAYFPFLEGLDQ